MTLLLSKKEYEKGQENRCVPWIIYLYRVNSFDNIVRFFF